MTKLKNNPVAVIATAFFALFLAGPIFALAASPATVNLGSAGNYAVLAKTGISTTGSTSVVGDMGVSPAAATSITGFALTLPAAGAFSTSALVTGKIYAPDYANPTPANITTAVSDMETAYTDASGRAAGVTELGAGNIGGLTLASGVYKWGTGVTIPTDVTLSGSANDIWIFQIAQNLDISSATKINLAGGARAGNIFWVVAGQTTIGTTAVFSGNILDQTAIVLNTGATLNGRALAQTAVTLDSNAVTMPSVSVSATSAAGSTASTSSGQAGSPQATPATPATPAVPTVSPAVPATPATPANSTAQSSPTDNTTDAGCLSGNKFSITTGRNCVSTTGVSASASAFGGQVRAVAINLIEGSKSTYVTTLQQFLISQNKGPSARALANHGVTTYFGVLTRAALAEFQASVGISPALGNFGSITRAYIKANY